MQPHSFYKFVISAAEGPLGLVSTGRLPRAWIEEYVAFIKGSANALQSESNWPKWVLQGLHYATLHLSLRYYVWATSTGLRNSETEDRLGFVRFETECSLWACILNDTYWQMGADVSSRAQLGVAESTLIDICFGARSPVGALDKAAIEAWKKEYERLLAQCRHKWHAEGTWPRLLCMAVHFASLCVELIQIRNVDLSAEYCGQDTNRNRVECLVGQLQKRIVNPGVVALVKLWLDTCTVGRDGTGLPQIGVLRDRASVGVSVRTASELFLCPDIA